MKKQFLIVESADDEATFKAIVKDMKGEQSIEIENTDVTIDFEKKSAEEEFPRGLIGCCFQMYDKLFWLAQTSILK